MSSNGDHWLANSVRGINLITLLSIAIGGTMAWTAYDKDIALLQRDNAQLVREVASMRVQFANLDSAIQGKMQTKIDDLGQGIKTNLRDQITVLQDRIKDNSKFIGKLEDRIESMIDYQNYRKQPLYRGGNTEDQ